MAEAIYSRNTEAISQQIADSARRSLPTLTRRRIHGRVQFPGKTTAVVGMRRAGKTTFLHQVRADRLRDGIPQERLPFVCFEDERLATLPADSLGLAVAEYFRQFPAPTGSATVTWCLDETQAVPGWERFVKHLLDTELGEVLMTGSSAELLSREVTTSLRGRRRQVWTIRSASMKHCDTKAWSSRPTPTRSLGESGLTLNAPTWTGSS